jgi:hypothetical protein
VHILKTADTVGGQSGVEPWERVAPFAEREKVVDQRGNENSLAGSTEAGHGNPDHRLIHSGVDAVRQVVSHIDPGDRAQGKG